MPPDQRAARVARVVSELCDWTAGELLGQSKVPALVRHRAIVLLLVQDLYGLTDSQVAGALRRHPQIMRRSRAIVEADRELQLLMSLARRKLSTGVEAGASSSGS